MSSSNLWVKCSLLFIVFSLQLVASELIQDFRADENNSSLGFSGEHAGMPFKGVFEEWNASLTLPPAEKPEIKAVFQLGSAKTGDKTYDSTLPEGDWFDIENYPTGSFRSTQIEVLSDTKYLVSGTLSLRGVSKPIKFELLQSEQFLTAAIKVERLAYHIGLDSDPEAEWVSAVINIDLKIKR